MNENMKQQLDEAREQLVAIQNQVKEAKLQINQPKDLNMSLLSIGIIGFILGGFGAGITVHKIHQSKQVEAPKEEVASGQIEVQLQLTDLDLLKIPCSDEYIEKNKSDLLCRELFCLMQTRGIDSQVAGSSCEEISNISNTIEILEHCKDFADQEECYRLFRERK